jgi:hypothetical protein
MNLSRRYTQDSSLTADGACPEGSCQVLASNPAITSVQGFYKIIQPQSRIVQTTKKVIQW